MAPGRYHTDTSVRFEVELTPEQMADAEAAGLEKRFKMSTSISLANMNLFDIHGRIRHYESPLEIIEDFYALRLSYYGKRKDYMVERLGSELERLENKVRFILAVVNGELKVSNRKKADLIADLEKRGFARMTKHAAAAGAKGAKKAAELVDAVAEEDGDEDGDGAPKQSGGAVRHRSAR